MSALSATAAHPQQALSPAASAAAAAAADAALDAELDTIFSLFARAGAGGGGAGGAPALGVAELARFLVALDTAGGAGGGAPGAPALAASALVARYDSRGAGALAPADFRVLCASEALPGLAGAPARGADAAAEELARVFSAADADGDGLLDRADVRRLLETDGAPATDREADEVLEQAGDDVGETTMTLAGFMELGRAQGW